jgi:hypothetical protein
MLWACAVSASSLQLLICFCMMFFFHDGLRTITAEKARHSSKISGIPSDFSLAVSPLFFKSSVDIDYFSKLQVALRSPMSTAEPYPFPL